MPDASMAGIDGHVTANEGKHTSEMVIENKEFAMLKL